MFQKVRNVIKKALKLLFSTAKLQEALSAWGLRPQAPVCDTLELHQLFSTEPKLDNFCAKNIYFWFTPL